MLHTGRFRDEKLAPIWQLLDFPVFCVSCRLHDTKIGKGFF